MVLDLYEMEKIMSQVTAGERGPDNESNEAKTFRMDVEEDMREAKQLAKEKDVKNVTFDLSPEWPDLDMSLAKFPKGHFGK
jgi:poly-D-alanine transfer protein DltD